MRSRSFKKIISILVVLVMVFSGPFSSFGASGFTDTSGHWAAASIEKGVSYGFIKGYSDGTFKPDNPVTRAEFSKMLNAALGVTSTIAISFSDVPSSEWYYSEVKKAVSAGFITGYQDNTFKPNSKITRQEAAIMISKILPPAQGTTSLSGLGDSSSIADWARAGVMKVFAAGYIKGDNNNLYRPTASLSRAEAATILTRLVEGENIVTANSKTSASTTLSNKIYVNDLTIDKALGSGSLNIDGCLVLGTLYVNGGGTSTVTLTDTLARKMIVAKTTGDVRVLLTGYSTVEDTSLTYGAILEQKSLQGDGFKVVNLDGGTLSTQEVGLVGSFDQINVNTGSIIKSTSGTIANLDIARSASGDTVKLSGTYTTVNVAPKINLELLSGKISTLNMGSSSDNSTVKMSSGTTVSTAVVDGTTAFMGTGKITRMEANVNDITYETKPTTIVKGSGVTRGPTISADVTAPQPTFTPADGATSVAPDTKITIVFDEAIYKSNGNTVATADIQNIVQLRETSSTGTEKAYTATISSDKKTITITPTDILLNSKDYYIIILSGTIEDVLGNANSKVTSHFKTGTQDVTAPTVTFSPAGGATNVATTTKIILTFNEAVVKANGSSLSSSDFNLSDTKNIIIVKKNNSSGTDVTYTGIVSSDKKTITITPENTLTNGAVYYVAVKANALMDNADNTIPLTSITFTTAGISATKAITSFTFASPSATGVINETAHTIAVAVPYGTSVTSLVPTITFSGQSVSPGSGVAKNFTSPVAYTVTATDATTQVYTVTVTVADPPSPNAGLSSVVSITDPTPGAQSGANAANAIAWEIQVSSLKDALTRSDISVAASATFNLYSNSSFTSEITGSNTLPLAVGITTAYIKVTAQDTTTVKYYAVAITRDAPAQATPSFSPSSGAVALGTIVAITSSGADAIYYTIDGTNPATSVTGTTLLYSGGVTIDTPMTITAIAVKSGSPNSAVRSASYTQAVAGVPSSITLGLGSTNPVGGVHNVSIPPAGGTDTTSSATYWAAGTSDTIKFTVNDSTGSSTITIGGSPYTSGSDYAIPAAGTLTIVVTTTETGKITAVRTFVVTVTV